MAIKLDSLRFDMMRQNDGDWVEIPDLPGVEMKVRGFNYDKYQADLTAAQLKWRKRYGSVDQAPQDVRNKEVVRLFASHLLLDWRGFDVPYSRGLAEDMLASTGEFFGHVNWAITRVSQAEVEFVEDAAKNSEASSAGDSTEAA